METAATIISKYLLAESSTGEEELAWEAVRELAAGYRVRFSDERERRDQVLNLFVAALLEPNMTNQEPSVARAVYAEDWQYFAKLQEDRLRRAFFPACLQQQEKIIRLLLESIARCASGLPGKIPPTVGLFALGKFDFEDILYPWLTRAVEYRTYQQADLLISLLCSAELDCWADIGKRNDFNQTGIMVAIVHYSKYALGQAQKGQEFFKKLGQLPGFKEAINFQDSDGSTALHYCIKYGHLDLIHLLLDDYGPDYRVEDKGGRTAYDLALTSGLNHQETLNRINPIPNGESLTPFGSSEGATDFIDLGTLSSWMTELPPILSPSRDWACGNCKSVGCIDCSRQHILEYIRAEIAPVLCERNKLGPRMMVMPPEFPACPTNQEVGWRQGWAAEKTVFHVMVKAIQLLLDENPKFTAACFHSLRYGWKDNKWESDIDLVVLIEDASTGTGAGHVLSFLVEVKSRIIQKGAFGSKDSTKTVQKALRQLSTHCKYLKSCLKISLDWTIACVAFPNLQTPSSGEADGWEMCINECIKRDYCLPEGTFLLSSKELGSAEVVKGWLQQNYISCRVNKPAPASMMEDPVTWQSNVDDANNRAAGFKRLTTWCVLHCTGIVINQVSDRIEKQFNKEVTGQLALLTRQQNSLYHSTQLTMEKPLLIMGGPGTGKSFIAIEKLKKLEEDGMIDDQSPGIYIVHRKNIGLRTWLTAQLKDSKFIRVHSFQNDYAIQDLNERVMHTLKGNEQLSQVYCVIDQLEDFDTWLNLIRSVCSTFEEGKTWQGKMLWVLLNPFEVISCAKPEGTPAKLYPTDKGGRRWLRRSPVEQLITHATNKGLETSQQTREKRSVIVLRKRLRNTAAVNSAIGRVEMLADEPTGRLVGVMPEPISNRGLPLVLCRRGAIMAYGRDYLIREAASKISELHLQGVLIEDILFVQDDYENTYCEYGVETLTNYVHELDHLLVEEFARTSQAVVPSMAPIPVAIAKCNDALLDQVKEEDWRAAQEYFRVNKADSMDSDGRAVPMATSNEDVVKDWRRKMHSTEYVVWRQEETSFVGRYIALEVVGGMVRRALTVWDKKVVMNEKLKDHLLEELREALQPDETVVSPGASVSATSTITTLRKFIRKQRFLSSFLGRDAGGIAGCEAKVVVATVERDSVYLNRLANLSRVVSRAQVMCILIVDSKNIPRLKNVFPLATIEGPAYPEVKGDVHLSEF